MLLLGSVARDSNGKTILRDIRISSYYYGIGFCAVESLAILFQYLVFAVACVMNAVKLCLMAVYPMSQFKPEVGAINLDRDIAGVYAVCMTLDALFDDMLFIVLQVLILQDNQFHAPYFLLGSLLFSAVLTFIRISSSYPKMAEYIRPKVYFTLDHITMESQRGREEFELWGWDT